MRVTREQSKLVARELKGEDKYVVTFFINAPDYKSYEVYVKTGADALDKEEVSRVEKGNGKAIHITSEQLRSIGTKDTIGDISDKIYHLGNYTLTKFTKGLEDGGYYK